MPIIIIICYVKPRKFNNKRFTNRHLYIFTNIFCDLVLITTKLPHFKTHDIISLRLQISIQKKNIKLFVCIGKINSLATLNFIINYP